MSSLSKLLHVGWTLKGPDLLSHARMRQPSVFRPSASWYHDYPTAIIACLSLSEDPARERRSKLADRHCLIGLGAGMAWHILSVFALARRVPRYRLPPHSRSEVRDLIAVAARRGDLAERRRPLGNASYQRRIRMHTSENRVGCRKCPHGSVLSCLQMARVTLWADSIGIVSQRL